MRWSQFNLNSKVVVYNIRNSCSNYFLEKGTNRAIKGIAISTIDSWKFNLGILGE